jgi:hypothetical protein
MIRRLHINPGAFRSKSIGAFDNYTRTHDDAARQAAVTRLSGFPFKETRMPDVTNGTWIDVFDMSGSREPPNPLRYGALAYVDPVRRELCIPLVADRFSLLRLFYRVFLCALLLLAVILAILGLHVVYPSRYPHPIEYVATSVIGRQARYAHS